MPVLKVNLVKEKHVLNPLLDERLIKMLLSKNYFSEIVDFAKKVNTLATVN